MAESTAIEWTDATWNPIAGCSLVSPGCTNCYAMKMAARIEAMGKVPHYRGLTQPSKAGPVWTGKVARAPDHILTQPLRWKKPRRIFVNSMADLFHDDVPDAWIDQVFAVMGLAPRHTFQLLTKRSARMRAYFQRPDLYASVLRFANVLRRDFRPGLGDIGIGNPATSPLRNVWLGVSVEDQARADERTPDLLATPAAKRFISGEPLLGPTNIERWLRPRSRPNRDGYGGCEGPGWITDLAKLDWVIAGGESGPGARPAHPDWFRSLRDQCAAADVPFFFKQWGAYLPSISGTALSPDGTSPPPARWNDLSTAWMQPVGKKAAGALLDGREHREFPA